MDLSWSDLKRPYWSVIPDDKTKLLPSKLIQPHNIQKQYVNLRRPERVPVVPSSSRGNTGDVQSLYKNRTIERLRATTAAQKRAEQKTKRGEIHIANRRIAIEEINCASVEMDGSSVDSVDKEGGLPSDAVSTISDARKKQLYKWKQDKASFLNKPEKKPAFKAGTLNNKALPQSLPAIQKRQIPITISNVLPPPERRVTRAMAKGTSVSNPIGVTSTGVIKPVSQQMKNMTLTGINNRAGVGSAVPASRKPCFPPEKNASANRSKPVPPMPSYTAADVKAGSSIRNANKHVSVVPGRTNQPVKMDVESCEKMLDQQKTIHKMEVAVPKKLKPQAIDAVYTEYTLIFAQATKQLETHSQYWRAVLDSEAASEIPDWIRDDIVSAVGKVQLLLGSKLPQFAELLFSYLCKNDFPNIILECDLQGWWDVAAIQVSKVCSEFDALKKLEINHWTRQETSTPEVKKPSFVPICKKVSVKVQTKASKGMKEFLAMRRKAHQLGDHSVVSATSCETSIDSTSSGSSQELEKKFEGGFFVISSTCTPGERPNSRRSLRLSGKASLTPNGVVSTPGGRRLDTNLSFRSLALRNSMGPMYKLGARGNSIIPYVPKEILPPEEAKRRYHEALGLPLPTHDLKESYNFYLLDQLPSVKIDIGK